jgi:hypothetical protein
MGKIWRTPRPRWQIRQPPGLVSASGLPAEFVPMDVEPFAFRTDLFVPGTLHHSGNRPAPPSEHTPLERRCAFLGRSRQILTVGVYPADGRRRVLSNRMELFGSRPVTAIGQFRIGDLTKPENQSEAAIAGHARRRVERSIAGLNPRRANRHHEWARLAQILFSVPFGA